MSESLVWFLEWFSSATLKKASHCTKQIYLCYFVQLVGNYFQKFEIINQGNIRASGENKILELQPLLLTRVDKKERVHLENFVLMGRPRQHACQQKYFLHIEGNRYFVHALMQVVQKKMANLKFAFLSVFDMDLRCYQEFIKLF